MPDDVAPHRRGRPDAAPFSLFDSVLDRTGRRQLQRLISVIGASRGQVFVEQGMVSRDLLVLVSGIVELVKTLPDGRRLIIAFRSAGDPISLQRRDTPSFVSARAVSDCRLFRIEWERLGRLANRYPAIDKVLFDLASDDIANLQNRLLTLGRMSTEEKLASFILEFCQPVGAPSSLCREIHLPMRRAEIAEYLALTTESVSRVFSRLKRERVIAMRRPSRIAVLNRPALESIALGQGGLRRGEWPDAMQALHSSLSAG